MKFTSKDRSSTEAILTQPLLCHCNRSPAPKSFCPLVCTIAPPMSIATPLEGGVPSQPFSRAVTVLRTVHVPVRRPLGINPTIGSRRLTQPPGFPSARTHRKSFCTELEPQDQLPWTGSANSRSTLKSVSESRSPASDVRALRLALLNDGCFENLSSRHSGRGAMRMRNEIALKKGSLPPELTLEIPLSKSAAEPTEFRWHSTYRVSGLGLVRPVIMYADGCSRWVLRCPLGGCSWGLGEMPRDSAAPPMS